MWVTSSLNTARTPTAVALGNFDGLHRGHQQVVQPILNVPASTLLPLQTSTQKQKSPLSLFEAASLPLGTAKVRTDDRIYATVVTFYPHPKEFFGGQPQMLLTPLEEKARQLAAFGVDQLVLLPFDRELAALSPQAFVEKILVRQLRVTQVSVGEDFRFGCQRAGTAADLQEIAAAHGIQVNLISLQTCGGERISSSVIRSSLQEGDLQRANRLLGRAYTLRGIVAQGQQLGRTIGFPTANLQLPPEKFLPRQGVYCVRVFLEGKPESRGVPAGSPEAEETMLISPHQPVSIPGVMNIGSRPTVNGTTTTIEVHLLDWSGDLYGQSVTVSLEKFLRPEQKFASLEALKEQIGVDSNAARAFLRKN